VQRDQQGQHMAQQVMSALPPNADMCGATRDVRFGPKADIGQFSFAGIKRPRTDEARGLVLLILI
jgi:hypothetical protein